MCREFNVNMHNYPNIFICFLSNIANLSLICRIHIPMFKKFFFFLHFFFTK